MGSTLHLTNLGRLAAQFGVQTSPRWWSELFAEVDRIADYDGDWEQLIQERIDGLAEFRSKALAHGLGWYQKDVARP